MSCYVGDEDCPDCDGMVWVLQDWLDYVAVICAACGFKRGRLERSTAA